jgi:pimeloyl-ACP methyl ester carboxylesterase
MTNTHKLIGHGPHKVIALHGWFGSADGWGPFAELIDPEAFTYAFMDIRGYGRAKEQVGEYHSLEVARDTLALADRLGWSRFSLIGHSMGGMFIQRVWAEAPQRVEKLVALTPIPANGYPFDEASYAFFANAADHEDVRRQIVDKTTGNRLTPTWLDRIVQHSLQNSTTAAFAAYLNTWARDDFSAQIKSSKENPVPIQIIIGEHDPAVQAALIKDTFMAWYPNARLEVMANAGHYPMWETPVALVSRIESFLRG